uniref:Uncharacterized protein n=1 Tax=Timema genevievae TaxID=629358 RepID=A0A7R9PJD3_TIMGE|nr:unnamed protein product [Timema genevievae]
MVALTTCYKIPASATAPVNVNTALNSSTRLDRINRITRNSRKCSNPVKDQNLSTHQDSIISHLKARYVQVVVGLMLGLIVPSKMRDVITVILEDILLRVKNSSQHQGGVRQIQEDIPSASVQATTSCDLYVVNSSQTPARSSVQLEVNGVPLTMEVETVASASLMDDGVGLLRNEYSSVFKEVPGDIKGVEINVVLKEEAIPVFYGPHVIPIPLRDAAKKALGEMESSGFIQKTNAHTWETPLVIVSRANKSAWVCRDFSVTISLVGLGPLTVVQVATDTRKDLILSLVLTYVLNVLERVDPYVSAVKKPRFCHCVDEKM